MFCTLALTTALGEIERLKMKCALLFSMHSARASFFYRWRFAWARQYIIRSRLEGNSQSKRDRALLQRASEWTSAHAARLSAGRGLRIFKRVLREDVLRADGKKLSARALESLRWQTAWSVRKGVTARMARRGYGRLARDAWYQMGRRGSGSPSHELLHSGSVGAGRLRALGFKDAADVVRIACETRLTFPGSESDIESDASGGHEEDGDNLFNDPFTVDGVVDKQREIDVSFSDDDVLDASASSVYSRKLVRSVILHWASSARALRAMHLATEYHNAYRRQWTLRIWQTYAHRKRDEDALLDLQNTLFLRRHMRTWARNASMLGVWRGPRIVWNAWRDYMKGRSQLYERVNKMSSLQVCKPAFRRWRQWHEGRGLLKRVFAYAYDAWDIRSEQIHTPINFIS